MYIYTYIYIYIYRHTNIHTYTHKYTFLRIDFEVLLLTLSSWQKWAPQGDTLHMGVTQIRCIWGTSIAKRQCWNL